MRLNIVFALFVITLALIVMGCHPNRGHCGNLPQSTLQLPQSTLTCPCPEGGHCVCKDTCLCGVTCKCDGCPGKSDPLQLAANRTTESGRWVAISDGSGDYSWTVGNESQGRWESRTRTFRYFGESKAHSIKATTDGTAVRGGNYVRYCDAYGCRDVPINSVLGPPPMGPMMVGCGPGGCR